MSKPTYKKSAYGNAKPFTNNELMQIIKKYRENPNGNSWMSFDMKNETQTETMKENEQRYLQIMVRDLEGKDRPLVREQTATTTKSKCNPGKTDPGKNPSNNSFTTRILINVEEGEEVAVTAARRALLIDGEEVKDKAAADKAWEAKAKELKLEVNKGKFVANKAYIEELISATTDTVVSEKFPNLSDDQFEEVARKQEDLIRKQYLQWCVEKAIGFEFERLMGDDDERERINFTMKKGQTVASNVQRDRNPKPENPADKAFAKANGGTIPIDQWMVYYRIRNNKATGELWCKIFDVTVPVPKGAPKKLATMKNPDTNKTEFLNAKTVGPWLRYGSAFTGKVKYQLCIGSKGPRLHAELKEIAAKRGAKGESKDTLNQEEIDELDAFGGEFGGDDVDDDDEPPAPVKRGLTDIEKQMAEVEANAADDE